MKIDPRKTASFFKSVWNAVVGISVEAAFTVLFILAGLGVCALWWSVF
jgi:hypothetical protein